MTMIATMLLFGAQVTGAITLAEVLALPPEQAGDRMLEGQEHGRVATIRRNTSFGPPPGFVDYDVIEAPVQIRQECHRRSWRASFRHEPLTARTPESAMLRNIYGWQEIGLPQASGCADAHFARMGAGMDKDTAFTQLRRLHDVAAGRRKVTFECTTVPDLNICANPEAIRKELASRPAWRVSAYAGGYELWLASESGRVTTVRFPRDRPDHVSVERKIPAPF